MPYKLGFVMDQIAGHITNYRNLRSVTDTDPEIIADWHEIYYYKAGGKIERAHEKLFPFVPTYFTGIMRGSLETYRALRHPTYDAILTNVSVRGFFSRTLAKIPTLIDFDSTPLQLDQMEGYGSGKADPKPVAYLKWKLFHSSMHAATLLQAWSNWARQSAITDYGVDPAKVIVNPPGVNLDFWQPNPHRDNRDSMTPRKILFVGGDFRRKGGELLLEWYKQQAPDKVELHIVTREPVETRPGIYVYHDMQPNTPSLLKLYQASDLFVLPSLGECFGIATVEAMAAGLPVIASDVGGTADIVEPGRNGYIIPSRSLPDLDKAINAILVDENTRQTMATQARLIAEQRFDVRQNALLTLNYLKQIARPQTSQSSFTERLVAESNKLPIR